MVVNMVTKFSSSQVVERVRRRRLGWYWTLLCLVGWLKVVMADEDSHKYTEGESLVVWASSVSPQANNQETYEFYSLPYCQGKGLLTPYHETLAEALLGYRLENTGWEVKFRQEVGEGLDRERGVILCQKELKPEETQKFINAVKKDYEYSLVVDGIQVRIPVGNNGELYTHLTFNFTYNLDQVVGLEVTPSQPLPLTTTTLKFTYNVLWSEDRELTFNNRQTVPKSNIVTGTKEYHTRWLAIGNSFLMVLFLVGVVSVILLRTLRKDFSRYGRGIGDEDPEFEALERDLLDDFGWKQVHGDVFRPPPYLLVLSSALGSGTQICGVALAVLLVTIIGDLSFSRAKILTAGIVLYSLLAVLGGYSSTRFYTSYGGKAWVHAALASALAWPFCVGITSSVVNLVALILNSTRALPFTTILALLAIWLFFAVPLTLLGASLGRRAGTESSFPCRVNALPRPLPVKLWYQESWFMALTAGALSFSSLFIELYYIFRAFWTLDAPYLMYGFFLLSFLLLLTLTCCLSIVTTYLLLNAEDHRWHWFAFQTGSTPALYVYLYALYYFVAKSHMYGPFQTCFYFAYLALTCLTLATVLGTAATWAAALFVKKIYATVKID